MKNNDLILAVLLLLFVSCTQYENDVLSDEITTSIQTKSTQHVMGIVEELPSLATVPRQEIIIKYRPNVTQQEKDSIRNQYGVLQVKTCDCSAGNTQYELWVMDPQIQIEPTTKVIRNNDDEDKVELVLPNQGFGTPVASTLTSEEGSWEEFYPNHSNSFTTFLNKIVDTNTGVTVAILDTGIDVNFSTFSQAFLHNSSQNGLCNEVSGWNFVHGNNFPCDDDRYKHGTVIANVIHSELQQRGIAHQILPVKTADAQGFSDYFTTFCGLQYAIEMQADVINLSFGWKNNDPYVYDLFSDLVNTTDATIVCSAGNDNLDNDVFPHYPSSLPHQNVLSVAAAKANFNNAANYSNYGQTTVDFFAKGNKIYFPLNNSTNVVSHYGTSFATPLVSARTAELISNGILDVRVNLIQQFGRSVSFQKPVYYMHLIQ
jgi:subtilisin family serine protease